MLYKAQKEFNPILDTLNKTIVYILMAISFVYAFFWLWAESSELFVIFLISLFIASLELFYLLNNKEYSRNKFFLFIIIHTWFFITITTIYTWSFTYFVMFFYILIPLVSIFMLNKKQLYGIIILCFLSIIIVPFVAQNFHYIIPKITPSIAEFLSDLQIITVLVIYLILFYLYFLYDNYSQNYFRKSIESLQEGIKENKTIEAENQKLIEIYKHHIVELEQYINLFSHEFKMPLIGINTILDWFQKDPKQLQNVEYQQLLENRMNQLLDLFKDHLEIDVYEKEKPQSILVKPMIEKIFNKTHDVTMVLEIEKGAKDMKIKYFSNYLELIFANIFEILKTIAQGKNQIIKVQILPETNGLEVKIQSNLHTDNLLNHKKNSILAQENLNKLLRLTEKILLTFKDGMSSEILEQEIQFKINLANKRDE